MSDNLFNQVDTALPFLKQMDQDPVRPGDEKYDPPISVRDFFAALTVACVSIPMFIGIARLSGMPISTGLLSGIIGGLIVGVLSGSHTSITGPSAGLTFVISGLVLSVGSVEGLILAVFIAGLIQLGFAYLRLGGFAGYIPSSVLQGLLAAIGLILILKQIPHLLGHDSDPEGDMSFLQPDRYNTISEFATLFQGEIHLGALVVGFISLIALIALRWYRKKAGMYLPDMLLVIVGGTLLSLLINRLGGNWVIDSKHLIQMPTWGDEGFALLQMPNWSELKNLQVYSAAVLIALASSLETLLNTSATDRIDPRLRYTPPSRELFALGTGNVFAGLLGGLPMSSAIERSAVGIEAGGRCKATVILHGLLILLAVFFLGKFFSWIPLSVLAAILLVTGYNLIKPEMLVLVWKDGRQQWLPFLITLFTILFTNLLIGVVVGLCVAIGLILNSNLRSPLRRISEKHVAGEILHIELANQVSFLNRPALEQTLRHAPDGCDILLDATNTDYIDPDILATIRQHKRRSDRGQGPRISLRGFKDRYELDDEIQFVDFTSREMQSNLTPAQALQILRDGNERFCSNQRLSRDLGRQMQATSTGQHPFAAVLGCIDSRAPAETILDLGLGDVFSARIAGNIISPMLLGSLEFATAVVGAKLILVLGHTKCGAVYSAVKLADTGKTVVEATGCENLQSVLEEIHPSFDLQDYRKVKDSDEITLTTYMEGVAIRNVLHTVDQIIAKSGTIRKLVDEGKLAIVGGIYDVSSGRVDFMIDQAKGLQTTSV